MNKYNPEEEKNEKSLNNQHENESEILMPNSKEETPLKNEITEENISENIKPTEEVEKELSQEVRDEEGTPQPEVVREIETIEEYEEKTAGFWIRFWAFIADNLIVSAIIGILVNPIFYLMDWDLSGANWYAPITIISGIFYYAYFVITTKYFQQTVGKMIFGLKVKPIHGEKLTWSTVLFREIVSRFINNTIMPLYVIVAFTPKNMGIQDYFADTIVVQEKVYVKNEKKIVKVKEKQIEVNDSIHPTA